MLFLILIDLQQRIISVPLINVLLGIPTDRIRMALDCFLVGFAIQYVLVETVEGYIFGWVFFVLAFEVLPLIDLLAVVANTHTDLRQREFLKDPWV